MDQLAFNHWAGGTSDHQTLAALPLHCRQAVAVSVSLDSKMSVLVQASVMSLLGVSCEE